MTNIIVNQNTREAIAAINRRINILMIGNLREGKTSAINTILASYNREFHEVGKVMDSGIHITSQLKKYPLTDNIAFFDTPGLDSIEPRLLEQIIAGKIPEDTEIKDAKSRIFENNQASDDRKIHIIIYCLNSCSFSNNYIKGKHSDLLIDNKSCTVFTFAT